MRGKRNVLLMMGASVFFFTACARAGEKLEKPSLDLIVEISSSDISRIPPADIVKRCSEILELRNRELRDKVVAALRTRGYAYLELKQATQALKDFQDLCILAPKDAEAKAGVATALLDLGRDGDAITAAKEAIALNDRLAAAHRVLARILIKRRDWETASRAVARAMQVENGTGEALLLRAIIALEQGDAESSLSDINVYLENNPLGARNLSQPYYVRGMALLMRGRAPQALSNFLMARRLDPSLPSAALGATHAYAALGKWHAAAHSAQDLIRLAPDDPIYQIVCGEFQARIGKVDAARSAVERALRLDKLENATMLGRAAMVYIYLGDYAQASRHAERALEKDPDCLFGWYAKGTLLGACPDAKYRNGPAALKHAEYYYERMKGKKGAHEFHAWLLLAEAQAECGNFDAAVEWARKAVQVTGHYALHQEVEAEMRLFERGVPYRKEVFKAK